MKKQPLQYRRIILISQFLVETCAERSAEQLADALSGNLADLDLACLPDRQAALRLLAFDEIQSDRRARHEAKQLVMFDDRRK